MLHRPIDLRLRRDRQVRLEQRRLLSRRRLLLAGLALFVLGGCRADVTVAVRASAEGDGEISAAVSLDKEAAEQVPDLAEQLKVEDLKAAGWRIEGPAPAPGGRTRIKAIKAFASPAEATGIFEELTGPNGPFASLRLARHRSLLKTRTSLNGAVDLAAGLEAFSDEVLKERLGGLPLGVEPGKLEAELGKPLADIFGFRLTAELPGKLDGPASWQVRLGQTTAVNAAAEQWNLTTIALGATSAASGLALLAVLLRRRRFVAPPS
ncbi:MAG TPA: hypothetical protein VM142_12070 [Acidimicrobiales bacterium]|nr:hypothetical protein [Acidimicrobiales bacterium]